jgi:putative MATE family efflux protein
MSDIDARTRTLIEAPIAPTLLKLAVPNTLVLGAQAASGIIETYFVGKLGTAALAGVAVVFPAVMLMQMLSGGAVGGGISSSIARALGGRRRDDANSLAQHGIVTGALFALFFMLLEWVGGRWLFERMGAHGDSLQAGLIYANLMFSGGVLVWLYNSLASIVRGTGNMYLPAAVTCGGTLFLIPMSPLLIFGIGPIPGLGVAGGATALLVYYGVGSVVLLLYLVKGYGSVRLSLRHWVLHRKFFFDILRVGLLGAISSTSINVVISIATALVGSFGPEAIAGYGTASRLEYLLIPLVFGLGGPMVAMVGASMGAGLHERAVRIALTGGAIAFALTEAIGLCAAAFPYAWLSLFDNDPGMLETGALYLRTVGPVYGFFGMGLALYFASQGAGRLLWPVMSSLVRLVLAGFGGIVAIRLGGGLASVFIAQAVALVVYGSINVMAIVRGRVIPRIRRSAPRACA